MFFLDEKFKPENTPLNICTLASRLLTPSQTAWESSFWKFILVFENLFTYFIVVSLLGADPGTCLHQDTENFPMLYAGKIN